MLQRKENSAAVLSFWVVLCFPSRSVLLCPSPFERCPLGEECYFLPLGGAAFSFSFGVVQLIQLFCFDYIKREVKHI